jgi:GR25 family glycosyltransferase involved in LPS biosynthesis
MTTFLLYTHKGLDRLEHAREECRKVGLTPIEVQGFHGVTLGLQQKRHEHWPGPIPDGKEEYHVTPGHLSLCLNHMMLWHMAEVSGLDEVLILEDDIVFRSDFRERWETVKASADKIHDLDALWLEHCCVDQDGLKKLSGQIFQSKNHMCTAAVLWKRSGYRKALEIFHNTVLNTHIDILLLRHVFPVSKFAVVIPELAVQKTNGHGWESSLSGR